MTRLTRYRIVWAAWLGAIALSFALIEGWALAHDGLTLSRFVWQSSEAFPLLGPLIGGLFVGLLVHFFWHFSPEHDDAKVRRKLSAPARAKPRKPRRKRARPHAARP